MRQFVRVALLLMLLFAAVAQRRGFAPIPRPVPSASALPIREGVTPPTGTPPIATPPITAPVPPIGAVGGWRKSGGWPAAGQQQPAVVPMPYAEPYPVYVDSQAQPDDPQDAQGLPSPNAVAAQPQTTIVVAPPPQPAPAVPNSALAPCGRAPDPSPAIQAVPKGDPPSFYIAMKDGWIYIARAYWVDNDVLHYITLQGGHNQVSLAFVNRDVSIRLNAKRADEFQIPDSE